MTEITPLLKQTDPTTTAKIINYDSLINVEDEQRNLLHIPTGLKDLQALNKLLGETIESYYVNLLVIFVVSYIFLQTFSIPGSMWLSILGGALFGWFNALLLVCV
ncbi:24035_t:CDS:2, partial [Entrophospora sp. SA101]